VNEKSNKANLSLRTLCWRQQISYTGNHYDECIS
jgi:hypothetical protein